MKRYDGAQRLRCITDRARLPIGVVCRVAGIATLGGRRGFRIRLPINSTEQVAGCWRILRRPPVRAGGVQLMTTITSSPSMWMS